MNVRKGSTSFKDIILGNVKTDHEVLTDEILIDTTRCATPLFANSIEDLQDKVSHIITEKGQQTASILQLIIYDYLNKKPPELAHLYPL